MTITNQDHPLITISYENQLGGYKSDLAIGNITIACTKHFNWFQKLFYRFFLGIKIIDLRK